MADTSTFMEKCVNMYIVDIAQGHEMNMNTRAEKSKPHFQERCHSHSIIGKKMMKFHKYLSERVHSIQKEDSEQRLALHQCYISHLLILNPR